MVIGILGGMGTYATIQCFKDYARIFKAEKEWDRPRLIIDNRCTMPSRVRALLYGEHKEQLICEMTESVNNLINAGCDRIIFDCNTSHMFLPQIIDRIPQAEKVVVNIIDTCGKYVKKQDFNEVFILATEGTIESSIYQMYFDKYGINCVCPTREEYKTLRFLIETVKQDMDYDLAREDFLRLINRYDGCVLGCTELPIMYEKYMELCNNRMIFDPIKIAFNVLKEEYNREKNNNIWSV